MATSHPEDWNRVYAVDGRIGIRDAWTIDWWGAASATPGRDGDAGAYSARLGYETGSWNNLARIIQVGRDFDPEVGFLNRRGGYRFYETTVMWKHRYSNSTLFKDWHPHLGYRGYYGLDGYRQEDRIHIDITEWSLASGAMIGPEVNIEHQGLQQPFAIASNVTLPVGSYDYTSMGFDFGTNPSAPLSLNLRADVGGFYDGTRRGGSVTLGARRGSSLTTSVHVEYNDVRLDEGNFTRVLIAPRIAYFFTPRIMVQTLVQYSNQARVWTANARLGWLSTAGTGLFVVFNEGQEADGGVELANHDQSVRAAVAWELEVARAVGEGNDVSERVDVCAIGDPVHTRPRRRPRRREHCVRVACRAAKRERPTYDRDLHVATVDDAAGRCGSILRRQGVAGNDGPRAFRRIGRRNTRASRPIDERDQKEDCTRCRHTL